MEESGIIRNPAALTEEFIPERMYARDGQMQAMAASLAPLTDGRQARNILLYGPPGTGKTCIARHVITQLSASAGFSHAYVNCWNFESRFKILFSILQKIGADPSKHRVGTPIDEVIESLARKSSNKRLVVVLDEVDHLADQKAVYDLASIGATMVMVANDETATYKWDERIRSRLSSAERIPFLKYRQDELEGILKDRASWALAPGSITAKEIAGIAYASGGDARAAIAGLRAAAEKAEAAGSGRVVSEGMGMPSKRMPELGKQQEAILGLLGKGMVPSAELLEMLNSALPEPIAERTFRKHMEGLLSRGLVRAEGDGRWRKYALG